MFKLTGYLSADRVLNKVHELTYEETQELAIKSCRKLKLPKKVTLAIDFKEYYGNKNHIEIMAPKEESMSGGILKQAL